MTKISGQLWNFRTTGTRDTIGLSMSHHSNRLYKACNILQHTSLAKYMTLTINHFLLTRYLHDTSLTAIKFPDSAMFPDNWSPRYNTRPIDPADNSIQMLSNVTTWQCDYLWGSCVFLQSIGSRLLLCCQRASRSLRVTLPWLQASINTNMHL